MRYSRMLMLVAVASALGGVAGAQSPDDPTAQIKRVLPADVATRVLAVIARARSQDLPVEALENRALKFAAKGVQPELIEKSVVDHEVRLEKSKELIERARGHKPANDEVEAAAEVLRKGVDGAKVSELAKSAPSGRSLAVPLYVISSLLDRGLPSDDALQRVADRLRARASDRDLERIPGELPPQANGRGTPAETGRALGETKHPGNAGGNGQGNGAGGPPSGVPANGGKEAKPNPGRGNKPPTPPGKKP